jgi:hypothetical protein
MKLLDFGDVLKIGFFSGIMGLLRTAGVKIPTHSFWKPHGPSLGCISGAHLKCTEYLS